MKEIMDWQLCLKEHIKKIEIDTEKISSLLKMVEVRKRVISQIKLDDETASVIVEDYYKIIQELLIGLLIKQGMKSDNHECLISFFKYNYPNFQYEINIIYQLKNIRNRVSYDGVFVKKDYVETNELEIKHIINLLTGLLK